MSTSKFPWSQQPENTGEMPPLWVLTHKRLHTCGFYPTQSLLHCLLSPARAHSTGGKINSEKVGTTQGGCTLPKYYHLEMLPFSVLYHNWRFTWISDHQLHLVGMS